MAGTAQIQNLELVRIAASRLQDRNKNLPGIAVLYGPAGYGKTVAALAVAQENRSHFVQLRSAWTRKTLLEKILEEMSIAPSGTISTMLDQVCRELAANDRMLIIDEADHAVRSRSMLELLRDIYEGSQATLMIIGEEKLPTNLEKHERFHSRVLTWIPAQAVSLADARELTRIYAPEIEVGDCLLKHIVDIAQGSVRRVSVNLSNVQEVANQEGWSHVTDALWATRPLNTGKSPAVRRGK
ncbi:MAG: transposition protein [Rhodocyclales bacterium]|nr:transposition protein [Rhodocyclales bacterium]